MAKKKFRVVCFNCDIMGRKIDDVVKWSYTAEVEEEDTEAFFNSVSDGESSIEVYEIPWFEPETIFDPEKKAFDDMATWNERFSN